MTRRNSSSAAIASAPGRVDSPPTSTMSAPSATIFRPCSMAFSAARNFPPSENESGVTFNTPMIRPCRETLKRRSPIFHCLSCILGETSTTGGLFDAAVVDCWATSPRQVAGERCASHSEAATVISSWNSAPSIHPEQSHGLSSPHPVALASRQLANPTLDPGRKS